MLVGLFATTNIALGQQHTITLNANSGHFKSGDPTTVTRNEGQIFGDLPTPLRSGFTFAGWYTIPGHEETRVTNRTEYHYSVHQEMLHARWTKKTATLIFMNYDGTQEIGRVVVSADGGSLVDIDAATFQLHVADDEFFAGYYTRINGEGDRIYTGVAENNELHPVITGESPFRTGTTYLYAFKTHVKHVTHWDYTYSTKIGDNVSWINIDQDDTNSRIQYGKLTFMNNAGTPLKSIYFQADGVTNKTTTMDATLGSHTTTYGQFHLQLADATHPATADGATVTGEDGTTGDGKAGYWNVYFTDDQLSQFTRYNFEPIVKTSPETKATTWLRTTDPGNHDTWFTYTGANEDNNAPLNWTVKLTDLKIYPEYIIVKPLFSDTENATTIWKEISQLANLDGVTCKITAQPVTTGTGSSAEYKGSFPVWKTGATGGYGYAVGMVGFEVNGQKVYLNTTTPGKFSPAFNSAFTEVPGDNGKSIWEANAEEEPYKGHFDEIIYTIEAPTIPVVRFLPGSAPGAKLNGVTPEILWGEEGQTLEGDDFTKYGATCPGCNFLGWNETDGAATATYTDSYTFEGAKTLYPVWQDNEAPVITPEKLFSCINPVNVNVTDNIKVTGVTVKIGEETQSIDVTGLDSQNATLTLPAPEKSSDGIVTYVYTIDATDGTNNAIQKTVTIYSDHAWDGPHAKGDPTATENGSLVNYYVCEHCGAYKEEGKEQEMTPEEEKKTIIPAKSILVKTGDGGVETTRDWDGKVNAAVAKVKTSGTEEWTYLKMTADAEVEHSVINTPALPAILDLNGKGLKVDDGDGNLVDGTIYGNNDVTILLKDDGVTEYTNGSTVKGTIGTIEAPIRYLRKTNAISGQGFTGYDIRVGKWQALYLPFEYGSTTDLPYTFGTPAGVSITYTEAKLNINKDVNELAANTHYFVKSSTVDIQLDITGKDLLPYKAPTAYKATVSTDYTIVGSLKNNDNVAQKEEKSFWVLTNGGAFYWANKGQHQRPYHWVIYQNEPVMNGAKPAIAMTLMEIDDIVTGIEDIDDTEMKQNAPIYNANGVMMQAGKQLPRGIYISNGKKFLVK